MSRQPLELLSPIDTILHQRGRRKDLATGVLQEKPQCWSGQYATQSPHTPIVNNIECIIDSKKRTNKIAYSRDFLMCAEFRLVDIVWLQDGNAFFRE